LLISAEHGEGLGRIVQGTYQSPILVQWRQAVKQMRRLEIVISRFN